jgi:hypothetical protein
VTRMSSASDLVVSLITGIGPGQRYSLCRGFCFFSPPPLQGGARGGFELSFRGLPRELVGVFGLIWLGSEM